MSAPLVSVVIPARDAEATLAPTLSSLRAQTMTDWEAVVVDDGSTDSTAAIATATGDERIRVLASPGLGVGAARNAGFAATGGELVAFLDADDLWAPRKLEAQVAALRRRPDADVAYSWTRLVDAEGRLLVALPKAVHEDDALPALLVENFVASGSNTLIRRRALAALDGPFALDLPHGCDRLIHVELAARAPFALAAGHHVDYRQTHAALSRDPAGVLLESAVLIERMFAVAGPEHAGLRRLATAHRHRYVAWLGVRTGDRRLALHHARACVRLAPRLALQRDLRALLRQAALSS